MHVFFHPNYYNPPFAPHLYKFIPDILQLNAKDQKQKDLKAIREDKTDDCSFDN